VRTTGARPEGGRGDPSSQPAAVATRDKQAAIDNRDDRAVTPPGQHRQAGRDDDHQCLQKDNQQISDRRRCPTRDGEIGCQPDDTDAEDPTAAIPAMHAAASRTRTNIVSI
jgi:hypothetical protein